MLRLSRQRQRLPRMSSPSSPTASTSTPPWKPALARLPPSFHASRAALSPLYIDQLTHATLPSASLSETNARHPDLVRPTPSLQQSLSSKETPTRSKAERNRQRSRSASIGSLQGFVERGEMTRRPSYSSHRSLSSGSGRRPSMEDRAELLPPIEDDPAGTLADLSWGTKWWPFAVVEPGVDKGKGREEKRVVEDGKAGERGFLELFAGRGAVQEAREQRRAEAVLDELEEELLGTDLAALRIASTAPPGDVEADETPPHFLPATSPRSRPPTFLPTSTFSSRPAAPAPSLFSSLSLSNPFSTSASAPSSPPGPKPPGHGRRYSTGSESGTKRKDVDPLLDEEDKKAAKIEDDSHMDVFTLIKERYRCPKHPIVFCHGLFGFDTIGPAAIKPLQFSYWVGVKEALEAIGVEVLIARVPASASIEERAKVLCELIEQTFPGREVNLIGHSMGGLDARFLISQLKPTTFKVKSLTTIATPHRGSSFADFLLEDLIGRSQVPALLGLMSSVGVPGGGKAFDDLTTTKMARFNDETPDDPAVRYLSYGAEFEPGWSNAFWMSWKVINEREGANDGLVSIESARWGEYQTTLTNVNHLDLVGWVGKVRYGWAEWLGKPIKFKPVSFYCAVSEMLADEGL